MLDRAEVIERNRGGGIQQFEPAYGAIGHACRPAALHWIVRLNRVATLGADLKRRLVGAVNVTRRRVGHAGEFIGRQIVVPDEISTVTG